jgi:UDP-2,3-diacylglucosamine pyrophosphatase LpxH
MLIIISDLHLTDGSSGSTIEHRAFKIFRERIREMAYEASWRADGRYEPIEKIDIVLLGDVLDVIRSNQWLKGNIRPWDNTQSEDFVGVVKKITDGILSNNKSSLDVLRNLSVGEKSQRVTLPQADNKQPMRVGYHPEATNRVVVDVNIHYMVGNHDWFYHLQGEGFNEIRATIVEVMGLSNDSKSPFAHAPNESQLLEQTLSDHHVFARHGDIYDPFNYEGNRDASSLGDVIVVELLNRFPEEVIRQFDLPESFTEGLKEIDNVRPLLLIPVWIDALLDNTCSGLPDLAKQVKGVWNEMVDEFLALDFVQQRDKWWNPLDVVDKLELGLKLSSTVSFDKIADVVRWFSKVQHNVGESYHEFALNEQAYLDKKGFIVYGHTHHSEVIPLNSENGKDQIYMNSGTWRAVFELTKHKSPRFVGHKVMTYLTFFKDDERGGKSYEVWTGNLG